MPRPSKKSEAELKEKSRKAMKGALKRIDRGLSQLAKMATKARKNKMSNTQKEFVLSHLGESFSDFETTLRSNKESKDDFEIPE